MTRRAFFAVLIVCGACGGRRDPEGGVLPETLAGWTRTSLRDVPLSEMPDPLPKSSVARVQVADYTGPGKLQARSYDLSGSGVGLDLAQRWRPTADTVFFYAQRWFVVIHWETADRKALQGFTTALEKRLNAAGGGQ